MADPKKKAAGSKAGDSKPSDKKNAWLDYDSKKLTALNEICDDYKRYISVCKTERECVSYTVELAKKAGFKDFNAVKKVKAGDKLYLTNMSKDITLFVIGSEPLTNGMKILGAHIDSPRLDLKQVPLYEDTEMALLDTHYYGGIKKYQWVTLPLALHGVVCKKDGSIITINIGEDPSDPVVGVSDLLVHLSQEQLEKKASKVIEGEDLNVLVGSIPLKGEKDNAVKANILKLLKDKYRFDEDDFLSAEIEVVPAGPARDYGLDRSMIMGYGHDDRVCAYTSLRAIFDLKSTKRTAVCVLVDKEEIGSVGATGMQSVFFENSIAELLDKQGAYSDLTLRRALANSHMISSDVSSAHDPNFPNVDEKKNTAYFGKGLVFNKYTGRGGKGGASDANPEYFAQMRAAFDKHGARFQTAELGKVDLGGGGTIAWIMARYNMQVIDAGAAVLNMHAPWEIVSKSDVYEAVAGYKAFLEEF
jgi:aspartyl aminopeptidase